MQRTQRKELYLIEILHQTTTVGPEVGRIERCILSKFYIKPQQRTQDSQARSCCILSKFYIKPLLPRFHSYFAVVVSYRNSTSNHNHGPTTQRKGRVVSYRNSTSNHNSYITEDGNGAVVSYRNSTSNHNIFGRLKHQIDVVSYRNSTSNHNQDVLNTQAQIVVSYRNSTSNHNGGECSFHYPELYLIEILHQTTTRCLRA